MVLLSRKKKHKGKIYVIHAVKIYYYVSNIYKYLQTPFQDKIAKKIYLYDFLKMTMNIKNTVNVVC